MFYGCYLCANPIHERYEKVIGFITEGEDELPIMRKTKKELIKELYGNPFWEAGWVKIIQIEE